MITAAQMRAARALLGIDQKTLAELSGLSIPTIQRMESSSVLDRIQDNQKALVVDFSAVPFLDSTGANMIEGLAHKAHKHGVTLWLTGTTRDIRRVLLKHEIKRPLVRYAATVEAAISALQRARTTLRAGPTQAA